MNISIMSSFTKEENTPEKVVCACGKVAGVSSSGRITVEFFDRIITLNLAASAAWAAAYGAVDKYDSFFNIALENSKAYGISIEEMGAACRRLESEGFLLFGNAETYSGAIYNLLSKAYLRAVDEDEIYRGDFPCQTAHRLLGPTDDAGDDVEYVTELCRSGIYDLERIILEMDGKNGRRDVIDDILLLWKKDEALKEVYEYYRKTPLGMRCALDISMAVDAGRIYLEAL